MSYLHIVIGIGAVVVAAATAIYFSLPSQASAPQRTNPRRRQRNGTNDNGGTINDLRLLRENIPGDKCIMCLQEMTSANIRKMHCGHALDESCYQEFRKHRRQCPHCNQITIRIDLPGDNCAICYHPLEEETMEYLKCEHALHKNCLESYKAERFEICPVCTKPL